MIAILHLLFSILVFSPSSMRSCRGGEGIQAVLDGLGVGWVGDFVEDLFIAQAEDVERGGSDVGGLLGLGQVKPGVFINVGEQVEMVGVVQ